MSDIDSKNQMTTLLEFIRSSDEIELIDGESETEWKSEWVDIDPEKDFEYTLRRFILNLQFDIKVYDDGLTTQDDTEITIDNLADDIISMISAYRELVRIREKKENADK